MEDDDLISICSYCDSSSSISSDSLDDTNDVNKLPTRFEIIDPRYVTYGFLNRFDTPFNPITCYKCDSKMNTELFNKTGNKKYNYVKCGVCKKTFCKKCAKLCDNCQNWYCKKCVKHWYDLKVNSVKKYYCVYCERTYNAYKKMNSKCVLI